MSVGIIQGDCLEVMAGMEAESVHCVVTSPPYWGLRDYGVAGQLGMEPTLGEHIEKLVAVFREVRRVLRPDGTVWLNYGDCYATSINGRSAADTKAAGNDDRTFRDKPFSTVGGVLKAKDLCMMSARVAIALQEDGWWVRSEIIWAKPNPMPESVTDRPASAHEKIFLLTKAARYFYDAVAVKTPAKSETTKMPDGWDTGPGAHGSVHRLGREKGKKTDKQRGHDRRHDGFNNRWDQMTKAEQQATGANLRNVWTIATHAFSSAHFATFPPALVEPCIKAGTSEKGVCPECGAPWVREVSKPVGGTAGKSWHSHEADAELGNAKARLPKGYQPGQTIGWRPTCECNAAPEPCTVLDPFAGSGTTGMVALRAGRNFVGIELNPEYVEMARGRILDDAPLFNEER